MTDPQSGTITINDVSHVMDLLVRHLYGSDPHLTIRELIQNAHDATVTLPDHIPANQRIISISVNTLDSPGHIEISDSGVGMSDVEMRENFSKIGDSDKLKRAIDTPEIIGRFGIGFLSSFIISDHVIVETRKIDTDTTWVWEVLDKQSWTMTKAKVNTFKHGTRVRLYFRNSYPQEYAERINDLKTVDGVEKIVQTYCYLIRFPIRVGMNHKSARSVNTLRPPWESDNEAKEAHKVLFSRNEPLYTHCFSLKDRTGQYRANGVFFFEDRLVRNPSVQLYVKRMLVSFEDRELVCPYGVFLTGLVDSPDLSVDLARRQVSPFDPAYKWLRCAIYQEFKLAFIRFATRRPEEWIDLWPKIDNTFITYLLDAFTKTEDAPLKDAATSFLIEAGRFLPLYQVDMISGSHGRPIWRTIQECIERARRDIDTSSPERLDERSRIKIFYTKSLQPVEKDMLIHKYGELIDVGRPEKSHETLMLALHSLNEHFEDFSLVEVKISQFTELSPAEQSKWVDAIEHIRRGLVFSGRTHNVVAVSFEPKETPVVITDTNVDPGQLESLREQLSAVGGSDVVRQLLQFMDQMGAKGGSLTIHLNVNNSLLQHVRDHLEHDSPEVRQAAVDGLSATAWRAVLDYFGWKSTRDMLARDRAYTHQIITALINRTREHAALKEKIETADEEITKLRSELQDLKEEEILHDTKLYPAICGALDMREVNEIVVSESKFPAPQASKIIDVMVGEMSKLVESIGGVLTSCSSTHVMFAIPQPTGVAVDILRSIQSLSSLARDMATSNSMMADIITPLKLPPIRLAISAGEVFYGGIGPMIGVIGIPILEATQLVAMTSIYERGGWNTLFSEDAMNIGAKWGLWRAAAFKFIEAARVGKSDVNIYCQR